MIAEVFPEPVRRALDLYDVPELPDGFGDRVVARALAPIQPWPSRRGSRGGWRRGTAAAGAVLALLATATAAAMGWLGEPVHIPVISAIVERLAPPPVPPPPRPETPVPPVAPQASPPPEPPRTAPPALPDAASVAPAPVERPAAIPAPVVPSRPDSRVAVPEIVSESRRPVAADRLIERVPERLPAQIVERTVDIAPIAPTEVRPAAESVRQLPVVVLEPAPPREVRPAERIRVAPLPRPDRVRPSPERQRPQRERTAPRRM